MLFAYEGKDVENCLCSEIEGKEKKVEEIFHLSFSIRRITGSYFMGGFLVVRLNWCREIFSRDCCWEFGAWYPASDVNISTARPRVSTFPGILIRYYILNSPKNYPRQVATSYVLPRCWSMKLARAFYVGRITHHITLPGWRREMDGKNWCLKNGVGLLMMIFLFHAWSFMFTSSFIRRVPWWKMVGKCEQRNENQYEHSFWTQMWHILLIFRGNRYANLLLRAGSAWEEIRGNDSNFHFNK